MYQVTTSQVDDYEVRNNRWWSLFEASCSDQDWDWGTCLEWWMEGGEKEKRGEGVRKSDDECVIWSGNPRINRWFREERQCKVGLHSSFTLRFLLLSSACSLFLCVDVLCQPAIFPASADGRYLREAGLPVFGFRSVVWFFSFLYYVPFPPFYLLLCFLLCSFLSLFLLIPSLGSFLCCLSIFFCLSIPSLSSCLFSVSVRLITLLLFFMIIMNGWALTLFFVESKFTPRLLRNLRMLILVLMSCCNEQTPYMLHSDRLSLSLTCVDWSGIFLPKQNHSIFGTNSDAGADVMLQRKLLSHPVNHIVHFDTVIIPDQLILMDLTCVEWIVSSCLEPNHFHCWNHPLIIASTLLTLSTRWLCFSQFPTESSNTVRQIDCWYWIWLCPLLFWCLSTPSFPFSSFWQLCQHSISHYFLCVRLFSSSFQTHISIDWATLWCSTRFLLYSKMKSGNERKGDERKERSSPVTRSDSIGRS